MNVLVTGVAGFLGAALGRALLDRGNRVTGIDNLNNYYDVGLKNARLNILKEEGGINFIKLDVSRRDDIGNLFESNSFDLVLHLAAQAGVRHSIENPSAYIDANLVGFGNILEGCRQNDVPRLVYASSSSVYGGNTNLPFAESDHVDHPVSLYAATKKANELMAHAYSNLYNLQATGLRFFTVYGPWGRPDMALFTFTRNILAGEPILVYNHGEMSRDFTYIDDIVEGAVRVIEGLPRGLERKKFEYESGGATPHQIYNIGCGARVQLMDFIATLENCLGRKAKIEFLPIQKGEVLATEADVTKLESDFGYRPKVKIEEGIARFVAWYRAYYGIKN
jgi:UDP-glucuronate 4-epimerase